MAAVTAGIVALGAGAAMNAKAKRDAGRRAWESSRWGGFDLNGGGGRISFGPDGAMHGIADSDMQMFRNLFSGMSQDIAGGGGFGQDAIDFANFGGSAALPGAFGSAMDASMQLPTGAVDAFTNFSAGNAALGQAFGANALGTAASFAGQQTGINEGIAQQLFGFGSDALNNTDFSSLAADQLSRQRAFARPGEERAVNSKFQNLFNRGALSSTSGERQLGELALTQELADIQRVNSAEGFANMLQQQNRSFGLNAFGAGLGARAQDQSFNLNAANTFGGLGLNALSFGQNAGQAGLNTQLGFSELINSRGQQRLANAQGLLGFGQQLNMGNFGQLMQLFGGIGAMNTQMQNLMALSGNLSAQRSAANAGASGFAVGSAGSPFGSFLQGIGQGMLTGGG